jgi:hypothetical protein
MTSGSPDLWYAEVGQHKEAFQAMEPSLPEWHARVDEALGRREAARLLVEAAPGERLAMPWTERSLLGAGCSSSPVKRRAQNPSRSRFMIQRV